MKHGPVRTAAGLWPESHDTEWFERLPMGEVLYADITRPRNPGFHRKFFKMLQVGYEAWEPEAATFKGLPVQKNPDRFRADCLIAAGFYTPVVNINGDIRAEPESLSFGSMTQERFDEVYNAVMQVLLERILTTYTKDDLDKVVETVLDFA